jgi:hypothetical protein
VEPGGADSDLRTKTQLKSVIQPGRSVHQYAGGIHFPEESLYAKGLIAFEYEKLIGAVDGTPNLLSQKDPFWRAYSIAQKRFGRYCFPYIPTPSLIKKISILS